MMTKLNTAITLIDESTINDEHFPNQYVGCLVLTKDRQLILQKRGEDWDHYPGYVCEFGGHLERGESAADALQRELAEELGARVELADAVYIGALTEQESKFAELIYVYFWHDRHGTITGCYEGECIEYQTPERVLQEPKLTSGLRWLVGECKKRGLIT